jgi:hypothetical protein
MGGYDPHESLVERIKLLREDLRRRFAPLDVLDIVDEVHAVLTGKLMIDKEGKLHNVCNHVGKSHELCVRCQACGNVVV